MSMSNHQENEILDHVYGNAPYVPPGTIYFQLHDGDPGETGTANVIAGLARAALTNNATNFPAASGGSKTNGAAISWGSTAGQNTLPNATYISSWDALTGGNCLDYGPLGGALVTADRLDVNIPMGQLTISRA